MSMNRQGDYYLLNEKVVVSSGRGILGSSDDYDWEEFDPDEEIEVELSLKLPISLWDPIVLKVEVPQDYKKAQACGHIEEVSTPIEIETELNRDESVSYLSIEDITEGPSTGIIAVLKRKIGSFLDGARTDKEKEQMEEKRKESRIEKLKAELALLEGN